MNNMVKQVSEVMHQCVYTVFEKLHMESLLIHEPVNVHLLDCLPDMCIVEHVARGWGQGD